MKLVSLISILFCSLQLSAQNLCELTFNNQELHPAYAEASIRWLKEHDQQRISTIRLEIERRVRDHSTNPMLLHSSDPSDRRRLESMIDSWLGNLEEDFSSNNLSVTPERVSREFENQRTLRWRRYRIAESGTHFMNRLARRLKRQLNISIWIDPIENMVDRFTAAYNPNTFELIINEFMIQSDRIGNIMRHELTHALLNHQRLNEQTHSALPIHILFQSSHPIDPFPLIANFYDQSMSFEEGLTYFNNLLYYARGLQAITRTRQPTTQEIQLLHYWTKSLIQVHATLQWFSKR